MLLLALAITPVTSQEPTSKPNLADLEPAVATQLEQAAMAVADVAATAPADPQALANAHGNLGSLYFLYELHDFASASLAQARQLAPQDQRWPYLHALALEQQGELDEALRSLQRALELAPDNSTLHTRLGLLALQLDQLDEAEVHLRQALDASGDPAALEGLGLVAARNGQHQLATQHFERALQLVPEANRLHYALAQAYRNLGDVERARFHLERYGAVGVRPTDPMLAEIDRKRTGKTPHSLQGRKAFQAGSYAEAAASFRLAVSAAPEDAEPRVNLATALSQLGQLEAAYGELEKAVELDPDSATAHYNLGTLDLYRGDVQRARSHLRRAVELRPQDHEARLELARALRQSGDVMAAIEQLQLVVDADDTNAEAWLQLASAQIGAEDFSAGLRTLEHAHHVAPGDGPIAAALARVLAASPNRDDRNGARALDLAQRVYQAAPTSLHAELVSQALAELGRCAEATEWVKRSVEALGTSDPKRSSLLARIEHLQSGPPCRPE